MYGLYYRHGNFYIGEKLAIIVDDDLIVGRDECKGTPGLCELIVSKEPDEKKYTPEDYDNYARLMIKTNNLRQKKYPNRPRSSSSIKWTKILVPTWANRRQYEGSGVVVIPSEPNALLERLDLLLSSQEAGHTGVGNELVSVCHELKRQGVLDMKT